MILVSIKKDNSIIKEITITGHANYDNYGKDIVCAAVSSIAITTINAIHSINNTTISDNVNNDKLTIKVLKNDEITLKLLNNMINLLIDLQADYPLNIKIK